MASSPNGMQLQPKSIGREFVRRYYTILNQSPENLHCFYNDEATFVHDDIDPMEQKTVSVVGKQAIRHVMETRQMRYRHNCTIINGIDTVSTLNNGLVVQVFGEIAHNGERMRPFSQSFVLMAVSSLKYYVLNEIFRFRDFLPGMKRTISETESVGDSSKASHDMNTTFMDDGSEPMTDSERSDFNVTPESSAEAINELQTKHLKSLLQEAQSKDGRPPNYRKQIESAVTVAAVAPPSEQILNETAKRLFQDKCIITIGSVVNPNIKFDEDKPEPETVEELPPKTSTESQAVECTEASTTKTAKPQPKQKTKTRSQTSIESDAIVVPPTKPIPGNVKEIPEKPCHDENNNSTATEIEPAKEVVAVQSPPAPIDATEETKQPDSEPIETKPKSYAELLKLAREKSRSSSSSSRSSSGDVRSGSFSLIKDKPLIIRNSLRRKSDKPSPSNRESRGDNILQVFIGNIIQTASEDDLRRMFGRFGNIARFRMHSNQEKSWLPHYAFVTYDNIDAVRRCLAKRNSLYFPENGPNRLKLNVNGDESILLPDEEKPRTTEGGSNQQSKRRRDLKQFHKDFVISSSTKEDSAPVNRKSESKPVKNQVAAPPVRSHHLECDRIHGGRNQMRRIAGKA